MRSSIPIGDLIWRRMSAADLARLRAKSPSHLLRLSLEMTLPVDLIFNSSCDRYQELRQNFVSLFLGRFCNKSST